MIKLVIVTSEIIIDEKLLNGNFVQCLRVWRNGDTASAIEDTSLDLAHYKVTWHALVFAMTLFASKNLRCLFTDVGRQVPWCNG